MDNNMNAKLKSWGVKLLLVLLDILTVNGAYYLALVLRFYVKGEFHAAAVRFIPLFEQFAPYYTICCIVVFALFRLYSGMWRFAGINDANRILWANVVTCLIQIFGTLLFVKRMPITYYALGAVIQLLLVFFTRFAYRFLVDEVKRYGRGKQLPEVKVLVVGVGESAQILLRQLESGSENTARPVCVVDPRSREAGRLLNGLPVLGGLDSIREAVEKYHAADVIIADSLLPEKERSAVRESCAELGVGVQDFSGYTQSLFGGISLKSLMEVTGGPVEISLDEKKTQFENGEKAAMALPDQYVVKNQYARQGRIVVELQKKENILNNVNDEWVKAYQDETGEEVSFF